MLEVWVAGLSPETRLTLYRLLHELCGGMDVSRHNQFGFLRLRAEFETSGELFGCTLEELRDAVRRTLDPIDQQPPVHPKSALEALREQIGSRGHPDFR